MLKVEYIPNSVERIKRKMFATMGKDKPLSEIKYDPKSGMDKTLLRLMIGEHSPINIPMFEVHGWVTDRCHSHLRTHRLIQDQYWCSTSRTDISYGKDLEATNGMRYVNFEMSLRALFRLARSRLCPTAHIDIRSEIVNVVEQAITHVPEIRFFAKKPCVHTGYCTEPMKNCGYTKSVLFTENRKNLIELSEFLSK